MNSNNAILFLLLIVPLLFLDQFIMMMKSHQRHQEIKSTKTATKTKQTSDRRVNKDKSVGISGGQPVKIGEVKFTVAFLTNHNKSFCTGSILDQSHILTAAHCCRHFLITPNLKVLFGGFNALKALDYPEMTRSVLGYKIHPLSVAKKLEGVETNHDVCVVKYDNYRFDEIRKNVTPVKRLSINKIDEYRYGIDDLLDLDDCWIFGYGLEWKSIETGNLNKLAYPIGNKDSIVSIDKRLIECGYQPPFPKDWHEIKLAMKGDSGGPLLCRNSSIRSFGNNSNIDRNFNENYIQIGLLSFGSVAPNDTVHNEFYADYLEPINCFYEWIQQQLKDL